MAKQMLRSELRVAAPLEETFGFFADASKLETITPPELRFEMLTRGPIEMAPGTRIEYRLGLYGIRFGWEALISEWVPGERFVDEQLRGPYRSWVHLHEFAREGGATVVRDRVEYELPLGPLGLIALPLVRAQLERIFAYRRSVIARTLGEAAARAPGSAR
jgi:ligand-binding SRPBCC domain-containing protein